MDDEENRGFVELLEDDRPYASSGGPAMDDILEVETPPVRSMSPSYSVGGSEDRPRSPSGSEFEVRSEAGFRMDSAGMHPNGRRLSPEEIERQKREILFQLERLEKKGVPIPRKLSMSTPLDELRAEYDRIKEARDIDRGVQFYQQLLSTTVLGMEIFNGNVLPERIRLNLDGWSDVVRDDIYDGKYEDVLEDLYTKYRGRLRNLPPELTLLGMLSYSGMMFHLSNRATQKSTPPEFEEIIKEDPDLMRKYKEAACRAMNKKNPGNNAIMDMMSSLTSSLLHQAQSHPLGQGNQPPSPCHHRLLPSETCEGLLKSWGECTRPFVQPRYQDLLFL
jgi:hypothetical protein